MLLGNGGQGRRVFLQKTQLTQQQTTGEIADYIYSFLLSFSLQIPPLSQ